MNRLFLVEHAKTYMIGNDGYNFVFPLNYFVSMLQMQRATGMNIFLPPNYQDGRLDLYHRNIKFMAEERMTLGVTAYAVCKKVPTNQGKLDGYTLSAFLYHGVSKQQAKVLSQFERTKGMFKTFNEVRGMEIPVYYKQIFNNPPSDSLGIFIVKIMSRSGVKRLLSHSAALNLN